MKIAPEDRRVSELNLRRLEMDLIGGHRNPVYETVAEIIKDRDRLRAIEAAARAYLEAVGGDKVAAKESLRLALSGGEGK